MHCNFSPFSVVQGGTIFSGFWSARIHHPLLSLCLQMFMLDHLFEGVFYELVVACRSGILHFFHDLNIHYIVLWHIHVGLF